MEKIIIATNNKNKIKDFKEVFKNYEILSLEDVGFTEEIVEDGNTFEENATIKANTLLNFLKEKNISANIIADDSGLCVDALGGAPGIFSARYSGEHGNSQANRDKLLENLKNKNRRAHFVCCLVHIDIQGKKTVATGECYGSIAFKEEGNNGFGYDSLFVSDELGKTFGNATLQEKNEVSHRAKAVNLLLKKLNTNNHFRVSARAIIIQNGKLLTMFRRKVVDGKVKEYYVIPGGGKEEGESLQECVKRELQEEMNIEINVKKYLGTLEDENSQANYFQCEIVSGEPKLGGEELERMNENNFYQPQFVNLEEAKALDLYGKEFIKKIEN